jgi:hypothetical protein
MPSVKYHGRRGVVYLSTSAASAAAPVGTIRGFTLDMSRDYPEVTEFQDTNKTYVVGLPNFTGTLDGFFATDQSPIMAAQNSVSGVNIYLYPTVDAPGKWVGGPGFLDATIRTAVDQAVVETANFRANGGWTNNL